jgi:integrase
MLLRKAKKRAARSSRTRTETSRLPHRGNGSQGELEFENASPDAGREWTDDGDHRARQLKHRANGDNRHVPAHPELVESLLTHLELFGTAPDGRLFNGIRGGELPQGSGAFPARNTPEPWELPTVTYRRAWIAARRAALIPAEYASPQVKSALRWASKRWGGWARTHDRRMMRSLSGRSGRTTCTDTTESCRR